MTKKLEHKTWTSPILRYTEPTDVLRLNGDPIFCLTEWGIGAHLNIPKNENYRYWLELSTKQSPDAISVRYDENGVGHLPGGQRISLYADLHLLAHKLGVPRGRRYWLRVLYQNSPYTAAPALSEWTKVEDELPRPGKRVLVHTLSDEYRVAFVYDASNGWRTDLGISLPGVVEWILLPN